MDYCNQTFVAHEVYSNKYDWIGLIQFVTMVIFGMASCPFALLHLPFPLPPGCSGDYLASQQYSPDVSPDFPPDTSQPSSVPSSHSRLSTTSTLLFQ